MNRDIFIVSEYKDNGEPWGDNIHYEEPIAAFRGLESAERYCLSRGAEQELSNYAEHDREYKVFGSDEDMQCPYDNSFELLKIYRVCLFADSARVAGADSKMEYSVSELPGGRVHGSLKGSPKEAAWMLEKLEHEGLEQNCICNVSFGHIESIPDDVITDIVNIDKYINQVIINKKGGE